MGTGSTKPNDYAGRVHGVDTYLYNISYNLSRNRCIIIIYVLYELTYLNKKKNKNRTKTFYTALMHLMNYVFNMVLITFKLIEKIFYRYLMH